MPAVRTTWRMFVAVTTLAVTTVLAAPADAAPPVRGAVDITSPADGSSGTQVSPVVSGKATSPTGEVHVLVDGVAPYYSTAPVGTKGSWSTNSVINLSLGVHEICAEVRSSWDDVLARDCVTYTVQPDVARFAVDWPLDGSAVLTRFQVQGSCQDGTEVLVSLDDAAPRTEVCSDGDFWSDYLTTAGPHTITATLTYQGRALTTIERSFTATAPPAVDVEITSPGDATTVSTSAVRVEGTTNSPSSKVVLTVDGAEPREPYVAPDGTWWDGVPLSYGEHLVCATTSDYYGTSDRDCVTVTFAIPSESLVLTRPQNGDVSGTFVSYEGSCHSGTQLRIELDGALYREDTCYWEYFGGSIPYVDNGQHTLTVEHAVGGRPDRHRHQVRHRRHPCARSADGALARAGGDHPLGTGDAQRHRRVRRHRRAGDDLRRDGALGAGRGRRYVVDDPGPRVPRVARRGDRPARDLAAAVRDRRQRPQPLLRHGRDLHRAPALIC